MASFLITIDTEGDNIWSSPKHVTTDNSNYLPRFQALCEQYGLKPTYLTNYEMAKCDRFVEFARDALARGMAEIGMHLHAWNSPPLTEDRDRAGMPYLIEFPEQVIGEKVKFMTDLLEERFGVKMVSHRAGRWSFNEIYARTLLDHGYRVDCSVTPHVSWAEVKGFADGVGGTDFRAFPRDPYFIDPADIASAGQSPLLEVPMTITADRSASGRAARAGARFGPRHLRKAVARVFPPVSWFRPNGRNLASMRKLLRQRANTQYIEFMLHSSEFMPGGSPIFPDERSIERLYDHLEQIFAEAQRDYRGQTLSEFRAGFDAPAATASASAGSRRS